MADDIKAKFDKALQSFRTGDFAASSQVLKELIDQKSFSEEIKEKKVLQLYAESSLELGDFRSAIESFDKAELKAQAAFVLILDGEIAAARELYKQSPDSLAKHWGVFLCDLLDVNVDSISTPGFLTFRLFFESTMTYILKFNLEKYLASFITNAGELSSYFPEFYKCIGSAYMAIKNYDKAEEFYLVAKEFSSQDAEVYYKYGELLTVLDKKQEAINCFERTLELLPEHISSIKYIEKLKAQI